jgi:hypothetical protein
MVAPTQTPPLPPINLTNIHNTNILTPILYVIFVRWQVGLVGFFTWTLLSRLVPTHSSHQPNLGRVSAAGFDFTTSGEKIYAVRLSLRASAYKDLISLNGNLHRPYH